MLAFVAGLYPVKRMAEAGENAQAALFFLSDRLALVTGSPMYALVLPCRCGTKLPAAPFHKMILAFNSEGTDAILAARAHIDRQGGSTTVNLTGEVLAAAGLRPGAEVMLEASEGRIVITSVESSCSQAMTAFDRSVGHYGRTYAALAR